MRAIPRQLRYGVAGGIGLFITFIGFQNAGFIVRDEATLVSMGTLDPVAITFIVGLLITSVLVVLRVRAALILGIAISTLIAVPIGRWWGDAGEINRGISTLVTWNGLFAKPDLSLLFRLDLVGSLRYTYWSVLFVFLFTDMFDSLSTFVGVAEAGDLTDSAGEPRNVGQSMIVDACATMISGLVGTSSATSYIESATGIEEGGRTGLTAAVAGVLFLPFMFFSPLLSIVPATATAPALILVGVFMMKPVARIAWTDFEEAIPAYLALTLIPLTFSITQGIVWGFIGYTVLKIARGKWRQISPALIAIDILAIWALAIRA